MKMVGVFIALVFKLTGLLPSSEGCYNNKAALSDSSDDDNVKLLSFHGCYNQGAFLP